MPAVNTGGRAVALHEQHAGAAGADPAQASPAGARRLADGGHPLSGVDRAAGPCRKTGAHALLQQQIRTRTLTLHALPCFPCWLADGGKSPSKSGPSCQPGPQSRCVASPFEIVYPNHRLLAGLRHCLQGSSSNGAAEQVCSLLCLKTSCPAAFFPC